MLGQYFYNETIRKTIIAFGSLFNDIYCERKDAAGVAVQTLKVPLAYGPKQKFIIRLEGDPGLDQKVSACRSGLQGAPGSNLPPGVDAKDTVPCVLPNPRKGIGDPCGDHLEHRSPTSSVVVGASSSHLVVLCGTTGFRIGG